MTRPTILLAAVVAAILPVTAASAQTLGDYVATPASPAQAKVTTRGTVWFPRDGRLLAARAPEAPATLCRMVAKKVGPLSGFTAAGRAFDADALAQCNATATPAAVPTMAAN